MATNAELLALVDLALVAILEQGVQSYTIGDRTFTSLDVGDLLKWRGALQLLAGRETTGRGLGYGVPCP
jgi:hypothetical protein